MDELDAVIIVLAGVLLAAGIAAASFWLCLVASGLFAFMVLTW